MLKFNATTRTPHQLQALADTFNRFEGQNVTIEEAREWSAEEDMIVNLSAWRDTYFIFIEDLLSDVGEADYSDDEKRMAKDLLSLMRDLDNLFSTWCYFHAPNCRK